MTAFRYVHLSLSAARGVPVCMSASSGRPSTSSRSFSWNFAEPGRESAQTRNIRVSLVVSIPARKWSAHSDAMSRWSSRSVLSS